MRHLPLLLLLIAAPCLAQFDPEPDGVGIYFDEAATQVVTTAPVGSVVQAYLIATNPSQAGGLAMWTSRVDPIGASAMVRGAPMSGTNIAMNMPGDPGRSFLVGPASPLPPLGPVTVLATLWIDLLEEGAVGLLISPTTYRVDDFYALPDYELHPSSGSPDLPVAVINGEPPVEAEMATWGAVKSWYR